MTLRFRGKRAPGGRTRRAGFTMIEIALSIAVVAFALVAIIGVLPTGLTVQRENREDTIINQEGRYWLEAIRSGARGLHHITNYVEFIRIGVQSFTNNPSKLDSRVIIGLLSSSPLLPPSPSAEHNTNFVVAQVKALTGAAAEKGSITNEQSFRYQMTVQITPHPVFPPNSPHMSIPQYAHYSQALGANLYDVRLVLRWPVYQRGDRWVPGNNHKTFRALVAGRLNVITNLVDGIPGAFLEPNEFQQVNPPI